MIWLISHKTFDGNSCIILMLHMSKTAPVPSGHSNVESQYYQFIKKKNMIFKIYSHIVQFLCSCLTTLSMLQLAAQFVFYFYVSVDVIFKCKTTCILYNDRIKSHCHAHHYNTK